jgi:hypothetical protein
MRTFDPVRIGRLETIAWVAYYRREWLRFLRAAVGLTYEAFHLGWWGTARGAWLVLRANQLWAPHPDNDPDGARRTMRRFYALVAARHGESFDVDLAARLEIERDSDRWVREGCRLDSPLIGRERAALIRSYAALLAVVHRSSR